MTLKYHPRNDGKRRDVTFLTCPFCEAALDVPVKQGGNGVRFPRHWEFRCPKNPERTEPQR